MQDLSDHVFPHGNDPISALVPNSMAAGNMASSSRFSVTSPGSQPVDPLPPVKDQGDPRIDAASYDTSVVLDAAGTKINPDQADRASPYTEPGRAAWRSGRDIAEPAGGTVPRPVIRMGQWNEL